MKHFVTLAALLTSLSAVAQLPYNPDANGDGLIGAFDLTSLLSVYSGNFSNGVLGEGTSMAQLFVSEDPVPLYGFECNGTSCVVDLSLVPDPYNNINSGIVINANGVVNGTTLTLIKPSYWFTTSNEIRLSWSIGGDYSGITYEADIYGINQNEPICAKMVFWNGEWIPLIQWVWVVGIN